MVYWLKDHMDGALVSFTNRCRKFTKDEREKALYYYRNELFPNLCKDGFWPGYQYEEIPTCQPFRKFHCIKHPYISIDDWRTHPNNLNRKKRIKPKKKTKQCFKKKRTKLKKQMKS